MASMKCTAIGPDCPADGSSLGYAPNMAASIVFLGIFSISLVAHVALGWKYKTWTFLIAMALGSSSEMVGYLGRILMHNNPYKLSTLVFDPSDRGQQLIQLDSLFKSSVLQWPRPSTPLDFISVFPECEPLVSRCAT